MLRRMMLALGMVATALPSWGGVPQRPLRIEPGLVAIEAMHDAVKRKDYEALSVIQHVDAAGVHSTTEWTIPDPQAPDGVRRQHARRLQRAEDSATARRLILWHLPGDPETMPGTTTATPSMRVFEEVTRTGSAQIVVGAVSRDGSAGELLRGLFQGRKYFRGTVRKVGIESVRVLLDGKPTLLEALHVAGNVAVGSDQGMVELWWLNDREAPLALRSSFQGSVAQVVRIDRPSASGDDGRGTGQLLEELASRRCRTEVPGIYFLTDSAELLPASQPAIGRIAWMLKQEPAWTVTIEGHTDSTGSDAHNLELSRRRAAALKAELVAQHGVAAARLQTAGFGRTRPIDTNDTLDGRARNRRVEISRRC